MLIFTILFFSIKILNRKILRSSIFFISLLFPFVAASVFTYFNSLFQSDLFVAIMGRNNDLVDISKNPRIIFWSKSIEFFERFNFKNLFYFDPPIIIRQGDFQHNHFHNTVFQLYHDRGLILLIIYSVTMFNIIVRNKIPIDRISRFSVATIFFLFLVGANETILLSGYFSEIFFITNLVFLAKYTYEYNKKST
ncbi:hypothetical protein [Draconibacterium mangrovi]|uniref:hypothetical protein n=1 Tax=Draconibacterium mangrovi TaxID=2697469 RepID=UPI003742FB2E